MKIIHPGHLYELANHDKPDRAGQILQFIEKAPSLVPGQPMTVVTDGTTNEEVAHCLINRIQHLNYKFPCRENALAITKVEEALMWINKRTADRLARGVEGKAVK